MLTQWLYRQHRKLSGWAFDLLGSHCIECRAALSGSCQRPWCDECRESFLHKPRCERCGLLMLQDSRYCGSCLSQPPPWDRLYCVGSYEPPLSTYVKQLKYRRQFWRSRELAALLVTQLLRQGQGVAPVMVATPLHWQRQLIRGFNQSDYLARFIRQEIGLHTGQEVNYYRFALKRDRQTRSQSGLNRHERKANVRGAFSIHPRYRQLLSQQEHVAIVDDVLTTGSTLSGLCALLRTAGVKRIDVYCVCRATKPMT